MRIPRVTFRFWFFAVLITIVSGFVVIGYYVKVVSPAFYVYAVMPLAAIFILLSPGRNISLGVRPERLIFLQKLIWLCKIIFLQLVLTAVFYGVTWLNGTLLPIGVPLHSGLFLQTFKHFPALLAIVWSVAAVIAVGLAYNSYCKHRPTFLSQLVNPMFPATPTNKIGLFINSAFRFTTQQIASMHILFLGLLLTGLFIPTPLYRQLTGFHLGGLVLITILLLLLLRKSIYHRIKKINIQKNFFPAKIFLLTSLIVSFIIIFFTFLFHRFSWMGLEVKTPSIIMRLFSEGWDVFWKIFVWMWWLCWMPLAGFYIAKISFGYRVWQVILAVLIFPVVLWAVFHAPGFTGIHLSLGLKYLFPILGMIYLFFLFFSKENSCFYVNLYLPPKSGRIYRNPKKWMFNVIQMVGLMIYFFFPIGIVGLTTILFIFFLPLYFIFILQAVNVTRLFFLKSLSSK